MMFSLVSLSGFRFIKWIHNKIIPMKSYVKLSQSRIKHNAEAAKKQMKLIARYL